MKTVRAINFILAFVLSLGFVTLNVRADGTEELLPASIPIEQGSGIVVAGTGMRFPPAGVNFDVPVGAAIRQVILYWSGEFVEFDDDTLEVNGNEVTGTLIGGPTYWFTTSGYDFEADAYRADITDLGLVTDGNNSLTFDGLDYFNPPFPLGNGDYGVGVVVIYDDGVNAAMIDVRDGSDLAHCRFPDDRQSTVAVPYVFEATDEPRTAQLALFMGSVKTGANLIDITVGGNTTTLVDELHNNSGGDWDTLVVDVDIPAGETTMLVEVLAISEDRYCHSGQPFPASLQWVGSILSLPLPSQPGGALGEIGDTVWCDLNNNGIQDGEPGIKDVVVNLINADGDVVQTQMTNEDGFYLFLDVPEGSYTVKVDPSSVTPDKVPGANCPEPYENGIAVDLGEAESFMDADFCFTFTPGSIGDTVFCDFNDNGIQDAGEPGIPGVIVTLTGDCPSGGNQQLSLAPSTVLTAITDANGEYLFEDLTTPCDYTVEVDVNSTPALDDKELGQCPPVVELELTPDEPDYLDADFCFVNKKGQIGDTVYCDLNNNGVQDNGEPGIDGVFVELNCVGPDGQVMNRTAVTANGGKYLFTDIATPSRCSVVVDPTSSPALDDKEPGVCPLAFDVALMSGESYLDADFCFVLLEECADCDGKVTELTLRYDGEAPAVIKVEQKKDKVVVFEGPVLPAGEFSFVGQDKHGTLGTEIKVYVDGVLNTKIHTSCSKPIGPGLVSGLFTVVKGYSLNGGLLCPIDTPDDGCGECRGKVTKLKMRYDGDSAAHVVVMQKKDKAVVYDGVVGSMEEFEFVGTWKKGTLGTEILVYVDDELNTKIHTSCSQPIGPGLVSGDFTVIEGYSREGGLLCPADGDDDSSSSSSSDDDPVDGCECDGKVTTLTLRYLGDDGADIVVKQKKDGEIVFNDMVNPNGEFNFSGSDDKGTLGTEISIYVNGVLNVQIHTSCSKPIETGMVVGSFKIISGASLNGGPLCPIDGNTDT